MAAALFRERCLQLVFPPFFFGLSRAVGLFFGDLRCGYSEPGSVTLLHASPGGSGPLQMAVFSESCQRSGKPQ